jgi:hypothetical protein
MLNTKSLQVVALTVASTAATYYGLHRIDFGSGPQPPAPQARYVVDQSQRPMAVPETPGFPVFPNFASSNVAPGQPASPYLPADGGRVTLPRLDGPGADKFDMPLPVTAPPALIRMARPGEWDSASQANTPIARVVASRRRVNAEPMSAIADTTPKTMPLVLKEGTEVRLQLAQEISSKTSFPGDPVSFTVADELSVDDVVVVRAGSRAIGEITTAKRSGVLGRGGELSIRVDHLIAGGRKVALRGSKGGAGRNQTGKTAVLVVAFGGVGLLKHGKNISMTEGAPVSAYVAQSVSLPPAP